MERCGSVGSFSYHCNPQSRNSSELSEGRRIKGKVTTTQPHWDKKTNNNIRSYWFDLTLTCPLVLEQSAHFIITQLLGAASWRITSASGSVFRHTLSAAELRLVVDVRLDRG